MTVMDIPISLDVFKALTNRLSHEGQTFDDLLRDILGLDSPVDIENFDKSSDRFSGLLQFSEQLLKSHDPNSFHSRGLRLPHGTDLKACYKGELYSAHIVGGHWINADGSTSTSPSAAASAITGNNVNGLRFWEARLPGEQAWRRLEALNARR